MKRCSAFKNREKKIENNLKILRERLKRERNSHCEEREKVNIVKNSEEETSQKTERKTVREKAVVKIQLKRNF